VGLGLPWIVAWLVPAKSQNWRRGHWFRVVSSYLVVVVFGVVVVLIWPFVMTLLMDSEFM